LLYSIVNITVISVIKKRSIEKINKKIKNSKAVIIPLLSLAGIPPLLGFFPK